MTGTKRVWDVDDPECMTPGYGAPLDADGHEQEHVRRLDAITCTAERFKTNEKGEIVVENGDTVIETVDAHGWTMRDRAGRAIALLPSKREQELAAALHDLLRCQHCEHVCGNHGEKGTNEYNGSACDGGDGDGECAGFVVCVGDRPAWALVSDEPPPRIEGIDR